MSSHWIQPVTLAGAHVRLEPLGPEHIDGLNAAASDGNLTTLWYTSVPGRDGMAAYVQAADLNEARKIASKLRAGQVSINGGGGDMMAPFGGYKMSGNGREWGDYAFHEFLETKAVLGYAPKVAAE